MAKNPRFIRLVFLLIIGVGCAFQPPSLETVVSSQIGKTEIPLGSNWGPDVKNYLSHTHVKVPSPWCAAFVRYCLDSAGIKSTVNAYAPSAHNPKNVIWMHGRWAGEMQPEDVFTIYFPSMGRIAHTGFANRKINSHICETIEGNTALDGGREGVGVYKRKRSFNSIYSITRWQ